MCCTPEQQAAFHQRVAFCLDIYNQSIKAMRFPLRSYHVDPESNETTNANADWQGYWLDEDEEFEQ